MLFLASSVHHWWNVGWTDWVAVSGSLLTIISAVAASRRLIRRIKERDRKRAAKRARQIGRQSGIRKLVGLVPQLRMIVYGLDSAIADRNLKSIRSNLNDWRERVSTAHGILSAIDPKEELILGCLWGSRVRAAAASDIPPGRDGFSASHYSDARAAMAAACDLLGSWVAKNSMQGLSSEED